MPDPPSIAIRNEATAEADIGRLNKIIKALMDRAERSTNTQGSDFSLFQTAVILEKQVRERTAELEKALNENEKVNRALRESEAKFRGLVNQSLVGIAIVEHGKFSYSNPKFNEIFGYSADAMRTLGPLDLAVESTRSHIAEIMHKGLNGELENVDYESCGLRKDGAIIDLEVRGNVMMSGDNRVLISMILDVSERARAMRAVQALQEQLREQAIRDPLTGLYNRRYLDETLGRELILAERYGHPISVIMGDLDHFKAVNDRYGHLAGDEVLRVFGDLLRKHARGSDIYCRYGGEEFLLVLRGMAEDGAFERAEHLRLALAATPVAFGSSRIMVTASFGIAIFPHHGCTGDELTTAADSALYTAKATGRNRVCVSQDRSIHNVDTSV